MRTLTRWLGVVAAAPALLLTGAGWPAAAPTSTEGYVVVYADSSTPAERDGALRDAGADDGAYEHGRDLTRGRRGQQVQAEGLRLTSWQADILADDPAVASVEPDRAVYIDSTTQTAAPWGLDRIDQSAYPLDGSYTYDLDGTGVRVYIVDTGVLSTHTDLGGRVAPGAGFVPGDPSTQDCNGHGTHVSGIAAGATYGVAKGATIVPVRVLDCTGSGLLSSVVAGLNWVVADSAAHPSERAVVNLSLGAPGISPALLAAVQALTDAGVVTAVAAGNSAADACGFSPAAAPSALTVAATDSTDAAAYYSNLGACVDVFAPGSSITSDYIGSDTATAVLSGTSMASPLVAGLAADYLQLNPGAGVAEVAAGITTAAQRNVVQGTTTLFAATVNAFVHAGVGFGTGGSGGTGSGGAGSGGTPPGDRTAPVISALSLAANGPTVTATVAASDDTGVASYTYSWLRRGSSAPRVSSSAANSWTGLLAPGTWTLTVTAADTAGNVSLPTSAKALTIAVVAPTLSFTQQVSGLQVSIAITASSPYALAGYSVVANRSQSSTAPKSVVATSPNILGTVPAGIWWLHVRAVDEYGDWSGDSTVRIATTCIVPAVVGLSVSAAKAALTNAGCAVGTVTGKGKTVAFSTPGAGTEVAYSTPVGLTTL